MSKIKYAGGAFLVLLCLSCGLSSCSTTDPWHGDNSLKAEPSEQTYKPWAYWWWMGNSVTRDGISENLREYAEAGFGGLHIIPIYGEKGDEEHFIDYLSPEWMEMLVHTVSEAEKLGMGIDMTTGTGWPFGGPDITFEHSAKAFVLEKLDLSSVENIAGLSAGIKGGELVCLTATKDNKAYEDITAMIPESGNLKELSSYTDFHALIMRPTRQKVKRAAPGGEGLVMDYFNRDAIVHYFRRFKNAFDSTNFAFGRVRAFYNDSYEVYGANFTTGFMKQFRKLRSYDLSNYLQVIDDTASSEIKSRIITDYCETVSDLLYNEFAQGWAAMSKQQGMITRNQAHGSPGNLLDLYGACDIPETESFGVSDFQIPGLRKDPDFEEERFGRPNPLTMKFASSAAHILGKKLVASETATWLGDHFKVALSQVKPQIDELFTAGINHIFYHGITYNPPDKPFPGRLFYASTNFGTRSHFWKELPALNQYIASCQEVLQNSEPDNDVLVYFPIHDLWAGKYTDELILRFDVHHSENWLQESKFGELVSMLWKKGFCIDYISDRMIAGAELESGKIQMEGGSYKAIVVPRSTYMPEESLKKLQKLAASGACVIFQEDLPESVPGYYNLRKREVKFTNLKKKIRPLVKIVEDIPAGLSASGIENEELAALGLSFIRKSGDGVTIYFISNLADSFSRGEVRLSGEYATVEWKDPLSGDEGALKTDVQDGKTRIELFLEPGQSCILRCSNAESSLGEWQGYSPGDDTITIDSKWTITALSENLDLPVVETDRPVSWTEFGGAWPLYSGKAMYSCDFELGDSFAGREMILDLGDVRETARVSLNGKDIGLCWCLPFRIRIPAGILEKNNRLEIELTNLSFNKVIDLDRRKVPWKQFHEINFVNIRYEPYDASAKEPVASGLLSEIKLIPLETSPPNIIFILADDLGYNDVAYAGQEFIKTPHIDQLALEGRIYTQCYAGAPVCGPSRSVLMTGKHTGHTTVRGNMTHRGGNAGKKGDRIVHRANLLESDYTIGNLMQDAGYRTCLVGKWHLGGYDSSATPLHRGFDEFYGWLTNKPQTYSSTYWPDKRMHNHAMVNVPENSNGKKGYYHTQLCSDEAIDFIRRNKSGEAPFALFLCYNNPHAPLDAPDNSIYEGESWPDDMKTYASMIHYLDSSVGKLKDAVIEEGLAGNTLIFFASDNGPRSNYSEQLSDVVDFFDSNGKLRGYKRDLYEGGIRTPMIVWSPGLVEAGSVSDYPWYFADMMPTFADIASYHSAKMTSDGISVYPSILGRSMPGDPRYLYWEFFEGGFKQALRYGKWKAVKIEGVMELYDLSADEGETKNLAGEYPEIVREMEDYLAGCRTESPYWITGL